MLLHSQPFCALGCDKNYRYTETVTMQIFFSDADNGKDFEE